MTSSSDDASAECVLIERACLRLVGPLGFNGRLRLTDRRLAFVTTSKLDKMVGAQDWDASIADISAVAIEGLQRAVTVRTTRDVQRFIGTGAKYVYERLDALLADGTRMPGTEGRFAPKERVFLQGPATCFVGRRLATTILN